MPRSTNRATKAAPQRWVIERSELNILGNTMTPISAHRFIWTDKVALAAGVALFALIGMLWLFAYFTIGSAGAQHMLQKSGGSGMALAALATASLWVVLQGIDFVAKGVWRLATRNHSRARLAEGSLIDGRPFRGTVSAALPFEATPAFAPMMAPTMTASTPTARTRSNTYDLRSSESLEAA
jgi:hypothetical protein